MATLLVLLVFVAILLPLTLLFLGAIAALVALVARITSVSTWTVRAESADRLLEWRVRGLTRSRRKLHDVAHAVERGDEAFLEDASRSDPGTAAGREPLPD